VTLAPTLSKGVKFTPSVLRSIKKLVSNVLLFVHRSVMAVSATKEAVRADGAAKVSVTCAVFENVL
jgi:hypothetical protein